MVSKWSLAASINNGYLKNNSKIYSNISNSFGPGVGKEAGPAPAPKKKIYIYILKQENKISLFLFSPLLRFYCALFVWCLLSYTLWCKTSTFRLFVYTFCLSVYKAGALRDRKRIVCRKGVKLGLVTDREPQEGRARRWTESRHSELRNRDA